MPTDNDCTKDIYSSSSYGLGELKPAGKTPIQLLETYKSFIEEGLKDPTALKTKLEENSDSYWGHARHYEMITKQQLEEAKDFYDGVIRELKIQYAAQRQGSAATPGQNVSR
jgi:hypothetical protein